MKHPVWDRFLMLLFAAAALCGAAVLAAVSIGRITQAQILALITRYDFTAMIVRVALMAGAVIAVLFGLMLFAAIFPAHKKRSSSFAIQKNENGVVRISLKALETLVQKCLKDHEEISVVSSSLYSDEDTVRVDAHIQLQQGISMPLAISSLQKQIKKYIEACSGVMVQEVRICVDGVTSGDAGAKSPYAIPETMISGDEPAEEASPFETKPEEQAAPAAEAPAEAPAAEAVPEAPAETAAPSEEEAKPEQTEEIPQ